MRVPLTYRDATGELQGELETDGRQLEVVIGGTRFAGGDLDGLDPCEPATLPTRFAIAWGSLCACRLDFALPITVLEGGSEVAASIGVELEIPWHSEDSLEHVTVWLELVVGERRVRSSGASGWFEDELIEIQRACPDLALKICFGCGLSDYHPVGHGLFGHLMCYRGNKAAYRAVRSKQDLFALAVTEYVQETHVCDEFEPRAPGTGYRG